MHYVLSFFGVRDYMCTALIYRYITYLWCIPSNGGMWWMERTDRKNRVCERGREIKDDDNDVPSLCCCYYYYCCACVWMWMRRPYRVLCQLGEAISKGSDPYLLPVHGFHSCAHHSLSFSRCRPIRVIRPFPRPRRTPATKSPSQSQSV
jgi:hypothetical protein